MVSDDANKAEIKRLDGRINRIERDVSELWSQFNTYRDTSRVDITTIREHLMTEYKDHIRGVENRMKEYVDNADKSIGNAVLLRFVGVFSGIVAVLLTLQGVALTIFGS